MNSTRIFVVLATAEAVVIAVKQAEAMYCVGEVPPHEGTNRCDSLGCS